jgi:hypothetical protein
MPAPVSQPADWSAYADVPLLHTIASAVIGLADVEGLASFHLPYPAEAQRALDRLVLACLLRGVEQVPAGVCTNYGALREKDPALRLIADSARLRSVPGCTCARE